MSRFATDGLGDWASLPFFGQPLEDLTERLAGAEVLPPDDLVFNALRRTQPDATRVLILGQDPYPTPGHAHGLAFSTMPDVHPLPRSLSNIYKELRDDLHVMRPQGDLTDWADQGVLLLNTALTVPPGKANGHAALGWAELVSDVLRRIDDRPRALLLWGKTAQKRASVLRHPDHFRIETAHPSPLSARRGFFGSRPFSRINAWLSARGETPIIWG